MTLQAYDKSQHTPFSNWIREQPEIDSKLGFITTNIDFLWESYKTNEWMLIEEKRYRGELRPAQRGQYYRLYQLISKLKEVNIIAEDNDSKFKDKIGKTVKWKFRGFHLLQFDISTPDDSRIMWLNGEKIEKEELMDFLKFRIYKRGLFELNEKPLKINEFFS